MSESAKTGQLKNTGHNKIYEGLVEKAKKLRQDTFNAFVEHGEAHLGGSFSIIEMLITLYEEILEEDDNYIHFVANISARQIITAGSAEQSAWEDDKIQHGIFTLNVLNALNHWEADNLEDGYITATELGQYLQKTVSKETGNKQTPQSERIRYSNSGEFIFSHTP